MARPIGLATLATVIVLAAPWAVVAADEDWPERLVGHGGPVKAVTLSDDGTRALTASFDYSVILWEMIPTLIDQNSCAHAR